MKGLFHACLTSVLDGGVWSAIRPGRFIPRERAPGTHWRGGWVGAETGVEAVAKKKITVPAPAGNRTPACSLELTDYTL